MTLRSADVLAQTVLQDSVLLEQVKNDPQSSLTNQAEIAKFKTPITDDPAIYRIVTASLCVAMILVAGGIIFLASSSPFDDAGKHKRVPVNALIALGSACVGALGGLLSPTSFRK